MGGGWKIKETIRRRRSQSMDRLASEWKVLVARNSIYFSSSRYALSGGHSWAAVERERSRSSCTSRVLAYRHYSPQMLELSFFFYPCLFLNSFIYIYLRF